MDKLTAQQAADLTGRPLRTIYSAVRAGHLQAELFGHQLSLERSEVLTWAAGAEERLSGRRKGKLKQR